MPNAITYIKRSGNKYQINGIGDWRSANDTSKLIAPGSSCPVLTDGITVGIWLQFPLGHICLDTAA